MLKKIKNSPFDLNLCLDYNIDTIAGTYLMFGDVNDEMHLKLLNALAVLNKLNEEPSGHIRIVLNTTGGSTLSALAIYEAIQSNPNPVNIVVQGSCLSAGMLILAAAQGRASTPSSQFLIHYGGGSYDDYFEKCAQDRQNAMFDQLICERSLITPRLLKKLNSRETYFGAQKALELGLIERII